MSEVYRRPGMTDPFALALSRSQRTAHLRRLSLPDTFRAASDDEVESYRDGLTRENLTKNLMGETAFQQFLQDSKAISQEALARQNHKTRVSAVEQDEDMGA